MNQYTRYKKEDLYLCYETFYHPTNMVLFVAGEVEPDKIFKHINEHIKKQKADRRKQEEIKRIYPEEPSSIAKKVVKQKLHVSRPLFALGFKDIDVGYKGERLLDKTIMNEILLDLLVGPSSEVYNLLYEEGLIDDAFGAQFTGEEDYGFAIFSGESPNLKK